MKYLERLGPIANILSNPKVEWGKVLSNSRGAVRTAYRALDVDWKVFNQSDYLFAHVTILSSVATEENGYRIVEPCDELVNANGNAWTNTVIQHCYKSFIGGDVFLDHVQIPSLSKGKILDAVLRQVEHVGKNGKKAKVWVVDLLTATNRKHVKLVDDIESGRLNTLSMGTVASVCQCSFCGKLVGDDDKNCEHLKNNLGDYVKDGNKKYIVSELIGAMDAKTGEYVKDSCNFIEASWVQHPAFAGAVVNYFVETEQMKQAREKSANELSGITADMFAHMRVADKYSSKALKIAQDELKRIRNNFKRGRTL